MILGIGFALINERLVLNNREIKRMNYQLVDFSTWPRSEHFKFYREASMPWFNICVDIEASNLKLYCKDNSLSFFHAYLYLTQVAIDKNLPFRYRIVGDEVRVYDKISVSCAVLADDETMRFCDMPYGNNFPQFSALAAKAEQAAKESSFIAGNFVGEQMKQDVVHMSVLPWVSFTSFSNARNTSEVDSVPKIVYGRAKKTDNGLLMPLSVEVHHGVMDGLHVGRFIDTVEQLFTQPALSLSIVGNGAGFNIACAQ